MSTMALASGLCRTADSVSSPPSDTPGTPSSPPSQYGLMLMPTDAPYFLGFGVGEEHYGYYEEYTPSSPLPPAGSSLDYSPSSLLARAGSPDYTPSEPSATSPYYTPPTPLSSAASPGYAPSTPTSSLLVFDAESLMLPDCTPSTPSSSLVSDAESPDYTTSTPASRAASPYYTPSTPPLSPLVSDAESRRRHHPYQRSSASRISPSRHQRGLG